VYKAINIKTLETVAIKRIQINKNNQKNLLVIESEVSLLKKLSHPNIVEFKDIISTKNYVNIVLEFLEGGSIGHALKTSGPLDEFLVNQLVKQILEGLIYIHSQNIIHRDIKAANLLIVKSGKVKLADFGLAIKADGNEEHSIAGSPYWMAPEVIQEEGIITSACDIWSLGATIIEFLTTKPPYFGENEVVATWSIINNDHPPLPERITNNLKDFLLKCFNKDPAKRPSAKELMKHTWITIPSKRSYKNFIKQKKDLPSLFNGVKVVVPERMSSINNSSLDSKYNSVSPRNNDEETLNNKVNNNKVEYTGSYMFTDNIIDDDKPIHILSKENKNINTFNSKDINLFGKSNSNSGRLLKSDLKMIIKENIEEEDYLSRVNTTSQGEQDKKIKNYKNNNSSEVNDAESKIKNHEIKKSRDCDMKEFKEDKVFSFKPKSMSEVQLEEIVRFLV
jgi:serine/threonine protein kinase